MIGKLSGKIDASYDDYVVIDVNGVGYLVFASAKTLHKLYEGAPSTLFIETHVREDRIHLYGFLTLEEKTYFNLLQLVSGIGTRMALSILSHLTPNEIQTAINTSDKNGFKAVPGVGAKLAERVIIELRDKVSIGISASTTIDNGLNIGGISPSTSIEVVKALTNLGFSRLQAQNAVQEIIVKNPEISINELIKLALKNRGSNDQ
jgi:Holliday junction DNA helicase RuvA